ncbi:MAG: FGGY-family carbohydrate kinase [Geminicoccaceae bacterium]|nr:FGGY-family carbohydrate kinase [Geminicoccaceae bacterium]
MAERRFLGIDCGTSGLRGIVIDESGLILAEAREPLPASGQSEDGGVTQDPRDWERALLALLDRMPPVDALAVDGTSGTLVATDADGRPLAPARMYDDRSARAHAPAIAAVAPPECGAHGATSALARLLDLQAACPDARHVMTQADWLASRLGAPMGVSDDNNVLKLGFDPVAREWPAWMDRLGVRRALLPEVMPPGSVLASGSAGSTLVIAGTTDGCASFLATGADGIGDAVTALGSTMTLKLMSDKPVFVPALGVYSHRMGDRWLVGGASNSGGKALLRFFAAGEIERLTPLIDRSTPTGRDWHPLAGTGERFPVQDESMTFEPDDRPAEPERFLQALLEGMTGVEARGYAALEKHGAGRPKTIRTVGGGARNPVWRAMREARLGLTMTEPLHIEAAYGTARLARAGYLDARR